MAFVGCLQEMIEVMQHDEAMMKIMTCRSLKTSPKKLEFVVEANGGDWVI